jgi:hypothetical protein
MAKRQPPTNIKTSTHTGQLSAPGGDLANYFVRNMPLWGNRPDWLGADRWRAFVARQEIAVLCRDAISSHLISLDWSVTARDSNQRDELEKDIKHYTKLIERGNAFYSEMDFTNQIEWLLNDLFTLPFGTAAELGREYNAPSGKVVWIRPLDGGTLSPTLNSDWPVMQMYQSVEPIFFPKEFISRVYLSPRPEIRREGWGMAPPEKIYLAMEMLNKGDQYYSSLLSNTPEAGILDLMDMDKTSAIEWVQSFRDLLFGINPLKIPVLYEHTTKAEWIPFGKLPSEIMYDSVTSRYITIVTAGYGLTPSDVGFSSSSNGGETLSGTIRQERRSARSGKSLAKKKISAYYNAILPETLEFKWIDYDDERNVAMSRARMGSANAFKVFVDMKAFSPDEVRMQALADGLVSIPVPEKLDREKVEWPVAPSPFGGGDTGKKLTNQVGSPKKPSEGGQGDVIPQQVINRSRVDIESSISKAVFAGNQILGALISAVREKNDLVAWEKAFDAQVIDKSGADDITQSVITETYETIVRILDSQPWVDTVSGEIVKSILARETETVKADFRDNLMKQAEQEFIEGVRDDLSLTEEEELKVQDINLQNHFAELSLQVRKTLLDSVASVTMLVSKSTILDWKYPIDTGDRTDNNIVKLARNVSGKVFDLFQRIVQDIGTQTYKNMIGDNNASYSDSD